MTPTSASAQVEPVDVDEGVQRHGRDQAAAVEPLGQRDPCRAPGARAGRGWSRGRRTRAVARPTGERRPAYASAHATPDDAGHGDRRSATETVRDDAAGERGECPGSRAAHAR